VRLAQEREIRTDRWHERSTETRRPGRGRTPDGELTLASGKLVAVELDLTPKRTNDFERILRSYKQERFDLVLWYVLPCTLSRLRKVVADNRADDYVEVRPWAGWIGMLLQPSGSSWTLERAYGTGKPTTPAMVAGKADHVWSTWEIAAPLELAQAVATRPPTYCLAASRITPAIVLSSASARSLSFS
jgi:hypothetical protein